MAKSRSDDVHKTRYLIIGKGIKSDNFIIILRYQNEH